MTRSGRRTIFMLVIAAMAMAAAAQQQDPPPTQAQQRPVFRGGTHFVRVDAYPLKDGKIVEGLEPGDFEVFEDGKRQAIESFDFVRFDTFTPEAERREPNTQREGFDKAADPRFRVFVIVVDTQFAGRYRRLLDPEAAGALPRSRPRLARSVWLPDDAQLGEGPGARTEGDRHRVAGPGSVPLDEHRPGRPGDDAVNCFKVDGSALVPLYFADKTYTALEGVVQQLGSIRQERKNIVFVSNGLPRPRPDVQKQQKGSGNPDPPRIGITNGRLGEGDHPNPFSANDRYCASEYQRLAPMDFDERYRTLIDEAKRANVSFYTITPGGLRAPGSLEQHHADTQANNDLISLAHETDGIAIVNTNDLDGGMKKIADDLAAYYVLGYYTTNTKFDGGVRAIKVRMKADGRQIRARRQYRSPTREEIAALSAPAAAPKPSAASPPAPALIGEPVGYRVASHSAPQKLATLELDRTDRLRVEWPALAKLDRRVARVLDRAGKPLPIDVPLSEDATTGTIVLDLPLAPFARGDYAIELTAGSATMSETRKLPFRIK